MHRDLAQQVIAIFDQLRQLHFPIAKMLPRNTIRAPRTNCRWRDDNTSAFNCRGIPGSQRWSQHAYGRAIDVNPLLNPSVHLDGRIEPTTSGPYLDRRRDDRAYCTTRRRRRPGLHRPRLDVGAATGTTKDYQHFELPQS